MRHERLLILAIAVAACVIRVLPAWDAVFTPRGVGFLETDAWYHVRLVENQVRNYPWRVTLDPYAAAGGQFVPIAPLFDTVIATSVVIAHGRDATTAEVERIAAFVPPVLGALTVVAVWALGRRLTDYRGGLIAAALAAILPGHFLDRTMLGFVDHHALEALLAVVTLWAFTRGVMTPSRGAPLIAGAALGLYLLSWSSGAFFVAILGAWFALSLPLSRSRDAIRTIAALTAAASLVALALVVAFQDPRMHRYGSQIVGLVGLGGLASVAWGLSSRRIAGRLSPWIVGGAVLAVIGAAAVAALAAPAFTRQLFVDIARLAPDPTRMAVLEARPLFLYSGEWRWSQPWVFFRTGFFIGLAALIPFTVRVWRARRPGDLLLFVYALAAFVATIGQNRFGYYLVTACALLSGWLAVELLDWGGVPHPANAAPTPRTRLPLAREVAVVAVAGGMFAPNLSPGQLLQERRSGFPAQWREAMAWLRDETPPPFLESTGVGEEYYYARYPRDAVPAPDYTVMSWWDQGYWIAQSGRRVPVSNPTQERAPNSARFFAETDEARAAALLDAERSRYVLAEYELPFRYTRDGAIMGRFQSVLDWAGADHDRYYEVLYRSERGAWVPVWVFHEAYYRSLAFRLAVLGGAKGVPANSTTVIRVAPRTDATGRPFRELVSLQTYPTYDAAREAAAALPPGEAVIVGLDPWTPAFPVNPLRSLVKVADIRLPTQSDNESPMVRIFQYTKDTEGAEGTK